MRYRFITLAVPHRQGDIEPGKVDHVFPIARGEIQLAQPDELRSFCPVGGQMPDGDVLVGMSWPHRDPRVRAHEILAYAQRTLACPSKVCIDGEGPIRDSEAASEARFPISTRVATVPVRAKVCTARLSAAGQCPDGPPRLAVAVADHLGSWRLGIVGASTRSRIISVAP